MFTCVLFQSTHPRGVRLTTRNTGSGRWVFQSTHPRGVRHRSLQRCPRRPSFQSTHPRGVRLCRGCTFSCCHEFQSTHPRGVRRAPVIATPKYCVSIHAPARGATSCVHPDNSGSAVSIHAPARGATRMAVNTIVGQKGFNPRTREGCDVQGYALGMPITKFQSTHPRGVRQVPARCPV